MGIQKCPDFSGDIGDDFDEDIGRKFNEDNNSGDPNEEGNNNVSLGGLVPGDFDEDIGNKEDTTVGNEEGNNNVTPGNAVPQPPPEPSSSPSLHSLSIPSTPLPLCLKCPQHCFNLNQDSYNKDETIKTSFQDKQQRIHMVENAKRRPFWRGFNGNNHNRQGNYQQGDRRSSHYGNTTYTGETLQCWMNNHRRIDEQRYSQERFNGMDPSRNRRESQQYGNTYRSGYRSFKDKGIYIQMNVDITLKINSEI
ncbi:hypothetical protein C1646_771399 [Rhizophagus diaphanus]|nr:hypothetical protein C1646_771399 [Rhizophagus diaphanus] [Rhizophagus sp. MUCL 43196]